MAFYQSISDHYDHIFPLNPVQVDFVLNGVEEPQKKNILDVGCGTGSFCIALAPFFSKLSGIDPDESMLEKARMKAADFENISWHAAGMLDLESRFATAGFDLVLCFGNTLAHLESEGEMGEFFRQAKKVLRPGGKLMAQIVNYDRIIEHRLKGLPSIENEKVSFVRNYRWNKPGEVIQFETILTDKQTGMETRNTIPLFPMRKDQLGKALLEAGFEQVRYYGNFKRDDLSKESIPLVIEACQQNLSL